MQIFLLQLLLQLLQLKQRMNFPSFHALYLIFILLKIGFPQTQHDENYSFSDYIRQFAKVYNGDEYTFRQNIFDENYQIIRQLEYEANGSCHFSVNNQTDWTQEQKNKLYGLNAPINRQLQSEPRKLLSTPPKSSGSINLPTSLDYRQLNAVTSVKNQGACGSCWAFSTVAQYQSLIAMKTNEKIDLSQQFVLDCSGGGSCNGGQTFGTLKFITENGLPKQIQFPYATQDFAYGPEICEQQQTIIKLNNEIKSIEHYSGISHEQLQQLLVRHGPVSVGIHSNRAFQYYSGGLFQNCQGDYSLKRINHAVLLVGYTSGGNYIIKNSWGTNWGEGGFMTIHKDYDCKMKQDVDVIELVSDEEEESDPQTQFVEYYATLGDSYGDGWHGLTLGIKQNNQIVSTFGNQFLSGSTYGPIKLNIHKNIVASIVVVSIASWTQQVSFAIHDQNNNLIFRRISGTSFLPNIVFHHWCPGDSCGSYQSIKVSLVDSYGDGWNQNVIGLKQNGVIIAIFGSEFSQGHNYGPIDICIPQNIPTSIVVYTYGTWQQQIGFIIRDEANNKLFERTSGSVFQPDIVFGRICLNCVNASPVNVVSLSPVNIQKPITDINDIHYRQVMAQANNIKNVVPYIIGMIVLGLFVFFFMVITLCLFLELKKRSKQQKVEQLTTDNNTTIPRHRVSQGNSALKYQGEAKGVKDNNDQTNNNFNNEVSC